VQWSEAVALWCVLVVFVVQAGIICLSPVRGLHRLPEQAGD